MDFLLIAKKEKNEISITNSTINLYLNNNNLIGNFFLCRTISPKIIQKMHILLFDGTNMYNI